MGLDLALVLSEDSHAHEYQCVICCCLCDLHALVTTTCSHVFCQSCLNQWLARGSNRCPSCNTDLADGVNTQKVALLKTQEPLAYRVLRRVRVRCPAKDQGCEWNGDYGDLVSHLTSITGHASFASKLSDGTSPISSDSDASPPVNKKAFAATLKEQGDYNFSQQSYTEASSLYSKALSIFTSAEIEEKSNDGLFTSLLANRSATRIMLKDHNGCIDDCNHCIKLDPTYVKAYIRRGKALTELGKFDEACALILEATSTTVGSDKLNDEVSRCFFIRDSFATGLNEMSTSQYLKARATFGSLLRLTSSVKVILACARAELGLGLVDRALRLSLQVARLEKHNAEAYEIRGRAMFFLGDFGKAMDLYREAARLDPDLESNKTGIRQLRTVKSVCEDARKGVFKRDFSGAVEMFTVALDACGLLPNSAPITSILHSERAEAQLRLGKFTECLKDCNIAIYSQEDCKLAWVLKAKALIGLNRYAEAVDELKPLMSSWGGGEEAIRTAYDQAVFEMKKENRPKYYENFGLPRVCSEMEIKKQYKVKALEYHPDKWMGDEFTPDQKKVAEEKFKLLGEGLEILTDQFKRQLYDEGYDRQAIEERIAAAQRAAHQPTHRHH